MPPRIFRAVAIACALGAAVALALLLIANLPATLAALRNFRWALAPVILGAVLLNWGLRFVKWHYYLHLLAIPLRPGASLLVFLAGFTMAISPGKFGEVLKAVLVRDRTGTEVSRTASAVMAERLTDVAGLLLLSAVGATVLPGGPRLLAAGALGLIAAVVVLRTPASGWLARRLLPERAYQSGPVVALRGFVRAGKALLAPGPLAVAVGLSVVSWFFECLALYLILEGLGSVISVRASTFLYAFASLAGAVSMLPGGLGVAEASLSGLLVTLGVPGPVAAAATLLVRAATLWLAVLVGLLTLLGAFRPRAEAAGHPRRQGGPRPA